MVPAVQWTGSLNLQRASKDNKQFKTNKIFEKGVCEQIGLQFAASWVARRFLSPQFFTRHLNFSYPLLVGLHCKSQNTLKYTLQDLYVLCPSNSVKITFGLSPRCSPSQLERRHSLIYLIPVDFFWPSSASRLGVFGASTTVDPNNWVIITAQVVYEDPIRFLN